jgi:hypothetical protein
LSMSEQVPQEVWEERLHMRAGRLIRFIELDAPAIIIANAKELLLKAALELEPKHLAHAISTMAAGIEEWRKDHEADNTGVEEEIQRRSRMT